MRLHLDIPQATRRGGSSDGTSRPPVSPQSSTSSSTTRSPSPPSPLTPGLSDHVARNPMEVSYRTEREKMPPLTPLTPAAFMNQLHSSGMAMAPPPRDPRLSLSNSWTLEFFWIVMSLASFGVIVVVLLLCDNRPLPDLPLNITLNTFVAFFSTMSKAAFMLPIAEAISQCKWNWFHSDRPLADFETFDEASRGFWGSVALLSRLRWKNVASLGAFVTVLSVLSSPITQQVISYPSRVASMSGITNVTTAAVQAWAYDPNGTSRYSLSSGLWTVMGTLLTPLSSPVQNLAVSCPTGSCSFPQFHSLGVCVQQRDITNLLNVSTGPPDPASWVVPLSLNNVSFQYTARLSPNCTMNSPPTLAFTACMLQPNESFAFADDRELMAAKLFSFPMMYSLKADGMFDNVTNPAPVAGWRAMEVFFHLCVQTYNVSVAHGNTSTQAVSSTWSGPLNDTNRPLSVHCNDFGDSGVLSCAPPAEEMNRERTEFITLVNPDKPTSTNQSDYFRAQRSLLDELYDQLRQATEGSYYYDPFDESDNGNSLSFGQAILIEALYNDNDQLFSVGKPLDPQVQVTRVMEVMKNVATGLTNLMRTSIPWTNKATSERMNAYSISGTAWGVETFVRVRWGWIGYMAAEIGLAAVFLVMTVLYTRRLKMQVLKSSPLATLLALNDETRSTVGGITTAAKVRSMTKNVKVNLVGEDIAMSGYVPSPVEKGGDKAEKLNRIFTLKRSDSKEKESS